jgi:hypothetical protein
VHQIIVNLTDLPIHLSAMACHVIYIASFANAANHALFTGGSWQPWLTVQYTKANTRQ